MKYRHNIMAFVCGVMTFLFFSFRFVENELHAFPNTGYAAANSILFCAMVGAYRWLAGHIKIPRNKVFVVLAWLLSAFFSLMAVLGKYYVPIRTEKITDSLGKNGGYFKIGLFWLGGVIFFFAILLLLENRRGDFFGRTLQNANWWNRAERLLFGRFSFLIQGLIIGICWLPHVIIRYPGGIWTDSWSAFKQYFGHMSYNSQHPVVYTVFLGKMTELGIWLGDAAYGLYLLVVLQTIALLVVILYTIRAMDKMSVPRTFCAFTLAAFAIVPLVVASATTACIDIPYSVAFLLLMDEVAYYLFRPGDYGGSVKHMLLTFAAALGTFFRYNGKYVLALLIVLVGFREGYRLIKKRQKAVYAAAVLGVLIVPTVFGIAGTRYLNYAYHAKSVSKRVHYAMPIQQISRYMVYHSDDVTDQEMETIQKVMRLDKEEYKELYYPYNFDKIKKKFNNKASKEEIRDFLKVWAKLFFRHPDTYIGATVSQNCFLFSPFLDNCRYYYSASAHILRNNKDFHDMYLNHFHSETWRLLQLKLQDKYYHYFTQVPVLGLLVNQGWYSLLLLGIAVSALCQKNKKMFFLCLPFLLSLAIIFVGPAINRHQRYMFPIMFSMPLLFGLFLVRKKEE